MSKEESYLDNFKRDENDKYWFELVQNKTEGFRTLMTESLILYLKELERLNICNEENMNEYQEYMKAVEKVFSQVEKIY